jgi:hypothetical protein
MGSGSIDPRFLDLETSWSFVPRSLYPRLPLDRRLGGPQSQFGWRGEEKILPLPGLELRTLCRRACSQLLYRLSYSGRVLRKEITEFMEKKTQLHYKTRTNPFSMLIKLNSLKKYAYTESVLIQTNCFSAARNLIYDIGNIILPHKWDWKLIKNWTRNEV